MTAFRSLLCWLLLAPSAQAAVAEAATTVDLVPAEPANWTIERLFAPLTGLFLGGSSYWYGERSVEVDTSPSGAKLEIFYLRANTQRRFARADSPILLRLPSRIDARSRDSVEIRARLDGYLHREVQFEVRSRETKLTIELTPLPNELAAITHVHLSNRGSLRFLTSNVARFRLHEMSDGFSISLPQTRISDDALENVRGTESDNIRMLRAEQLGEDLLVRVQLRDSALGQLDLRSTQDYDAGRKLHRFTVELVPVDGNTRVLAQTEAALQRVEHSDVFGCGLDFDRAMRAQLDPESLARALAPASSFLDPHLRAALERLGALSPDGLVTLVDGSKFRTSNPLDLAAASAQSAEVIGYLSLLRAFIDALEAPEHRRNALRGVVAPELDRARFDAIVERAEDLERSCRARAAASQSRAAPRERASFRLAGRRSSRGAL